MRNLNHLFSGQSHSVGPGEMSIASLLNQNPNDAQVSLGSAAVGTLAKGSSWLALARAGARGGARVGRPRCLRILTITDGSSMAAMIFKAPPQFGQRLMSISRRRVCFFARSALTSSVTSRADLPTQN